jgi:Flp pilus assembly protein CpaB
MNIKRMVYTTAIAAAVGLAGVLSTGIATANAAPVVSTGTHATTLTAQQHGPTVKLTHHQRKELLKQDKKELKKPQQVIAR